MRCTPAGSPFRQCMYLLSVSRSSAFPRTVSVRRVTAIACCCSRYLSSISRLLFQRVATSMMSLCSPAPVVWLSARELQLCFCERMLQRASHNPVSVGQNSLSNPPAMPSLKCWQNTYTPASLTATSMFLTLSVTIAMSRLARLRFHSSTTVVITSPMLRPVCDSYRGQV